MKNIQVPAVYIASDKIKTNEEQARLKRLQEKIKTKMEINLKAEQINKIIKSAGWHSKEERTGQKKKDNPYIIFSGFDWDDEWNDPTNPKRDRAFVPDRFSFADFRDKHQLLKEKGVLCNSGYEIHTAFGCLHSCVYCHVGNAFTIMLDIEKFIGKLAVLMQKNPWQKLYKYDNQSDIMLLEPEYGATKKLAEFFAREDDYMKDKYLMLYTKSDNVNFLQNLEHKGKTIICFTLSNDEVVGKYEQGTPSLDQRLEAINKCQEWGYKVRLRFSPIIPVKGWKRKNREMIAKVFSKTKPEVISLEILCHMTKEQFDDIFSGLAYQPQEEVSEYELFPHNDRKEMYAFFLKEIRKHNAEVKAALCLETPRMWAELSELLKQEPKDFYCCCGAGCV